MLFRSFGFGMQLARLSAPRRIQSNGLNAQPVRDAAIDSDPARRLLVRLVLNQVDGGPSLGELFDCVSDKVIRPVHMHRGISVQGPRQPLDKLLRIGRLFPKTVVHSKMWTELGQWTIET